MKSRYMAPLLIVIGLFIFSYPGLSDWMDNRQQQRLLAEWQTSLMNLDSSTAGINTVDRSVAGDTVQENANQQTTSDSDVQGILRIDKINLNLPILYGATSQHMKTTVAQIEKTGKVGEVGNVAIAGHRSRTYGRNFNRLAEMESGDIIEVETKHQHYQYVVTQKMTVKPDEVWVLEPEGTEREITLVTCEPMVNPTHRLIIKGKMVDEEPRNLN
ncbi:class D sortase [Paenibacillus guangzhouensis]|uniref:class D sortase n=1 Tax=Paenibacillus guangzhouensis TaxID=1473112 RepID=UPI0012676FD1|nr:class D sortase [Paenibacillus guangzhouensis]